MSARISRLACQVTLAILLAALARGSAVRADDGRKRLTWLTDEAAAFKRAKAEHRGVIVVFSAVWAKPAVDLDHAFDDPEVRAAVEAQFIPLRIDVSEESDATIAARERYHVGTLPGVVFMTADARVLDRLERLIEPRELAELVRSAGRKLAAAAAH